MWVEVAVEVAVVGGETGGIISVGRRKLYEV